MAGAIPHHPLNETLLLCRSVYIVGYSFMHLFVTNMHSSSYGEKRGEEAQVVGGSGGMLRHKNFVTGFSETAPRVIIKCSSS